MTKGNFIRAAKAELENTGGVVTAAFMEKAFEAFGAAALAALKKGDNVPLLGIGAIKVAQRAARMGRNPQTGEPVEIPAKKVAKFTSAKVLKGALK